MKDKENQVFDEYGNYDFPIEIKQERLNNATSQSEKIIYGSLITSTKCYNCIHFPLCFAQKGGANLEIASENDCCYYLSKLPENSVVLSREEYIDLSRNYVGEQVAQTRKETSEKDFNAIIKALETKKASIITHYGIKESVGADVAIRTVKDLAKQFCVEIKEWKKWKSLS